MCFSDAISDASATMAPGKGESKGTLRKEGRKWI